MKARLKVLAGLVMDFWDFLGGDICVCCGDDFYDGDGNDIKMDAMKREFSQFFRDALELNLNDIMDQVLERTRIDMSAEEKKGFLKRYVKNAISLELSDNGDVRIAYREKN